MDWGSQAMIASYYDECALTVYSTTIIMQWDLLYLIQFQFVCGSAWKINIAQQNHQHHQNHNFWPKCVRLCPYMLYGHLKPFGAKYWCPCQRKTQKWFQVMEVPKCCQCPLNNWCLSKKWPCMRPKWQVFPYICTSGPFWNTYIANSCSARAALTIEHLYFV